MKYLRYPLALLTFSALSSSAFGQLLLDFGNNGAYFGSTSPAHASGVLIGDQQFTEVSDDTTVPGFGTTITIDFGRNPNDGGDDADPGRGVSTVSGTGAGIFATALGDDGIISFNSDSIVRSPTSISIDGLPVGYYSAYVSLNYGGNASTSFDLLSGVGDVGSSISRDELTLIDTLNGAVDTSWQQGENYGVISFVITDPADTFFLMSEDLTIDGVSVNTTFSSLVIAEAIPEPSAVLLFAAGLGLLLITAKRRS